MTLPPRRITAEPNTRLEQLLASYPKLKADADAAAAELKTVVDAIKNEGSMAAPGESKVEIYSPEITLVMQAVESWRIDATRMKAENPELYVEWAKKSVSWKLSKARA